MLKHLFDLAKQLLTLVQETERNRTEIKELRQELKDLTLLLQRVMHEQRRQAENETHEKEKLLLRVQNELLKLERRLPGGRQKEQ